MLLGIYLNFSFDKQYQLYFWKVIGLRYVVGFILPMGVSVLAYAVEFKYDHRFVGMVSNTTILISFALLWGISNLLI